MITSDLVKLVVFALVSTASFGVSAQSIQTKPSQSSVYVGFSGGVSDIDSWKNPAVTWSAFDSKDKQWKIFGGYRLNELIAAEFSYNDLGKSTGSGTSSGASVTGKTTAKATVLALKITPIESGFVLPFVKVGAASLENKENSGVVNATTTKKVLTTEFYWGAGVEFPLNQRFSLIAEYEDFGSNGVQENVASKVKRVSPSAYSIGLKYSF